MKGNKRVSKTLLYMFYCICLEECYWTPQQFARQFAHIPRPKVVLSQSAQATAAYRSAPDC